MTENSSPEFLEIESLGSLFFTWDEIKLIINTIPKSGKDAALKGRLIKEAEYRKVVILQALNGSGEAQKLVERWIKHLRMSDDEYPDD